MFRSRKKSARLDAKRLGSRSRLRRSAFERLEDRRLLAAEIVWVGPNNGAWSQASHWNLGRVPAATDDVVIPSVAGDQNINFSSGTVSVNSITLAERLTLTGGSLQVTGSVAGGNVSGSGVVQLSSGTLRTAVLAATTQLVTAGGTLSGVTVNGAFTVNRGALTINSGLTLNGTMAVAALPMLPSLCFRLSIESTSAPMEPFGSSVYVASSPNSLAPAITLESRFCSMISLTRRL
jgi:hypothetical protein